MPTSPATILFDGVCNLCNGFVQFVLERDPAAYFRFASLQSEAARTLLATHGQQVPPTPETIMLLENGRLYTHSEAALRILRHLRWPWAWLYASILVPRSIRDAVYRLVARNRYRWFGRQEACWLPTPELAARFL